MREVEGTLASLPAERAGEGIPDAEVSSDELSRRRRSRATG